MEIGNVVSETWMVEICRRALIGYVMLLVNDGDAGGVQ